MNYFPGITLKLDLPDFCLMSSKNYKQESPAPGSTGVLNSKPCAC
jgi:hypothetical protein